MNIPAGTLLPKEKMVKTILKSAARINKNTVEADCVVLNDTRYLNINGRIYIITSKGHGNPHQLLNLILIDRKKITT